MAGASPGTPAWEGGGAAVKLRRLEGVNSLRRVHLPVSEKNLCILPTFHCCVGNSRSLAGLSGGLQQVRPGQGRGLLDMLTSCFRSLHLQGFSPIKSGLYSALPAQPSRARHGVPSHGQCPCTLSKAAPPPRRSPFLTATERHVKVTAPSRSPPLVAHRVSGGDW